MYTFLSPLPSSIIKVNSFLILNIFASHSSKLDSSFPDTKNQSFAVSSVLGSRMLDFSIFHIIIIVCIIIIVSSDFKLIKHHYFVWYLLMMWERDYKIISWVTLWIESVRWIQKGKEVTSYLILWNCGIKYELTLRSAHIFLFTEGNCKPLVTQPQTVTWI